MAGQDLSGGGRAGKFPASDYLYGNYGLRTAGPASRMADQRHGNHPDDTVLLPYAGKSGGAAGRTDGAEDVHALPEEPG